MSAHVLLVIGLLGAATDKAPVAVTIEEALASTRGNNISWKSLGEGLVQADAGRDIGIGLLVPKLQAQGQWIHMGERRTPDMSGFEGMTELLGALIGVVRDEHPAQMARFIEFQDLAEQQGGGMDLASFVPPKNTLAATFSLVVPVIDPAAIVGLQGAYDQYDAALQRIGHAREQLLYGAAKAYYSLVTAQSMVEVTERSIEAAEEHHRSNRVRAELQAATQFEVTRSELEVTSAKSDQIKLLAGLERGKAGFRYLTGLEGDFSVVEPQLHLPEAEQSLVHWLECALRERRDLAAARIVVLAAEHGVTKAWMGYLPTVNMVGQLKADNAEQQRFDDDPWSWQVVGTLSLNVWDGGIREAQLKIAKSTLRQAQLAQRDLEAQIKRDVTTAKQALADAIAVRKLAERQLEVAKAAQALANASAEAGAVTNLEVIDTNTRVFAAEAQLLSARLSESMALLDLLAACGRPVPFD